MQQFSFLHFFFNVFSENIPFQQTQTTYILTLLFLLYVDLILTTTSASIVAFLENLPEPPPLEEIIASAPPPEKGSFKDVVTSGHTMVQDDRAAKKKSMKERREAVEDANAAADMERINQASRNLASTIGEGMSYFPKFQNIYFELVILSF